MGKAVTHATQWKLLSLLPFLSLLLVSGAWAAAGNDDYVGAEDTALVQNVFGNDDLGGTPFTIDTWTAPANGTVTISATGVMDYQPTADLAGDDTFDYVIKPSSVLCAGATPPGFCAIRSTATVDIDVRAVADPPLVSAASVVGTEDVDVPLSVSAAIVDVDGSETIKIQFTSVPAGATLSAGTEIIPGTWEVPEAALSSLELTPPLNVNGTVTLTMQVAVTDVANNTDVTAVSLPFDVNLTAVDDPPTVLNGGLVLLGDEDQSFSRSLAGVFEDVDNPLGLSIVSVTGAPVIVPGSASISGETLTATFEPDQSGDAIVRIRAAHPTTPAFADVTVRVVPANDMPILVTNIVDVSVDEDSGAGMASFAGSFSDVDVSTSGDTLTYTYSISGDLVFATDSLSGETINFSLLPNANGTAIVEVTATDGTGADVSDIFQINVNPLNDAPTLENAIGAQNFAEDGAARTFDLNTVFGDVDILTNADVLNFTVSSNSNPALFDDLSISGYILTIDLAPDANGNATIVIEADDGDEQVTDTFVVTVAFGNDIPAPADDTVTMDEDEPVLIIDVLANDYLADTPTVLISAGVGGNSDSPTEFTYLNAAGDPVTGPNGTVTINGGMIEYRPKEHFTGVDTFSYTIQDCCLPDQSNPGEISAPATVTITVEPVNDLPTAQVQQTYFMFENETLEILADRSVIVDAHDIEYSTLDSGGSPVGGPITATVLSTPTGGGSFSFASDGTFTYTPLADWTGTSEFTYEIQDDLGSSPVVHTVRIVVQEQPDPAAPPTPGQVAVNFDLANTPLEQANGVTPNVLIMMDDSGSMDWNITTSGTSNEGVFRMSNADARTSGSNVTRFYYLWTLSDNTYGPTSSIGRAMPTEAALDANSKTDNNQYGAWRAWNSQFNVMYYDPTVRYDPWIGYDSSNTLFANANPTAVRLDPIDLSNTINLLTPLSYTSDNVPEWDSDGGTEDLSNTIYIPRYWTTTAASTAVPTWNQRGTLVEICAVASADCTPPATGMYVGSAARTDCGGDGNRLDCTYAEEIQNFANWFQYYRKREYVAKGAVAAVLEKENALRVGYETLNERAEVDVDLMNDLISEGNKKVLMDAVFSVNSRSGTPLRDALERAGDLYSCTVSGRNCPVLPAPDGTCQQNFTLLFSDGYWNGASGVSGDRDADGVDPWDGGIYADGRSDTLADTAMYYYETDLHPGMINRVVPTAKDRLARVTGSFVDEERMHQHMKTFTIAFGIEGSVDPSTVPTVPTGTFTWPDPASSDEAKIDDMLHAAVNGRGEFLSATRPSLLRDAIQDAFDEFSDAQSSTSSASFNSTSLREGTLLYRGFYDLEDSTGELTATAVDANGVLAATPTWSASDKLQPANAPPATRQLISFDPVSRTGTAFKFANLNPVPQFGLTANELDWMRGAKTLEVANGGSLRDRDNLGMLGDIVNSSPVFAGKPRGFNRDQAPYPTASGKLYSEFVETYETRTEVVWVGSNDGMMHAFDAEFGDELYAYVPYQILDGSARYANEARELTDPFYAHQYYVDLTPRINDVFMKPTTSASNRSWNTVLVGGLGGGGKGFFALNITDPGTAFNTESNAEQTVLWEFTEEDDTYPVDSSGVPLGGSVGAITDPDNLPVKDLGYSLSLPTVAMSNAVNGGDNVWVALFGNGPNSTAGIAKLFVLTLEGGLNGWGDAGDFYKISTDRGVPITEPAELIGFPNGLGSPTAVDEDLNGTVDLVFAGDRMGNLYRFDMRSSDPTQWKAVHLFTAYHDDGGTRLIQPIMNRPLVVPHPTKPGFLITFGTGSYLTDDDASDTSIQSIYGIWDPGTGNSSFTAIADSKDDRLVGQTITNVVDDSVSPSQTRRIHSQNAVDYRAEEAGNPGVYGWYIDLDMQRAATTQSGVPNDDTSGNAPPDAQFPGERAVRRFVIRNGNIITTTILPSTGKTSCFGTRPGSILLFDNATGGTANAPTIDFNTDGVIDDDDLVDYNGNLLAGGLLLNQNDLDGSLVDLSTLGGQGDTDFLFVSGGNDTVAYRIDDVQDNRTGRLSWSELQND